MKYKFHYLIFLMVITAYSCKNRGIEVTVEEGTNMSIALSPDESTIALSLQGTIFTIPVAGGDAVSVTDEMGDSQEPSWSPDGEYLTFHSYRDGNYHIWMVSKDGSGLRQLTSGLSDNREPDWSPDGKSIIFSSDRSGNYDIWQINLDNEELVQLTFDEANDSNPTFSNEGSRIAFVSQRAAGGIYILENNTERLAIPSAMRVAAPSWSKDDTQIAFVSFTGRSMLFDDKNTSYLYTGNPETGELVQVSAGDEDLFPFRVSWTNDHALIYAADGKIKKRATNGINPEIIPFKAVFTLNRESYARKEYDFNNSESRPALGIAGPMVSPDGSKIAFAALGDIYIQEIGGKLIQITNDSYVDLEPDWSPDGNTIAYTSDRGGKMEIWLHNIQTQEAKLLSSQISEDAAMPKWSPDGKQIAFYTLDYKKKWGAGILHIADVATGNIRVINRGVAVPGKPTWSPDGKIIAHMALKPHSSRFREGFNYFLLQSTESDSKQFVSPDSTSPLGMRNQNGPVWSPDGKYMAYVKGGTLWIVPVDANGHIAGSPKRIANELADNLSWTADAKTLVYIATDRIKKVNIDSGNTEEVQIDLQWKTDIPVEEYIVHAGKLFNGKDNKYLENVDIYIKGNRISEIKPHKDHPTELRVVDASDKTIIPGLFEMHTHQSSNVGEKLGKVWLSYGITSVREPGSDPYDALERKEAWESGVRPGPRLFFTGGLTDGTRVAYGLANSVTEPEHIQMELERAKKLNYDLIKTYVRMPDSIQKVLTEGAHSIGIPLSSHELYPATKYNVDAIEHLSGTSRRGYSLLLDANFRSYDDVVQLIAQSKINITPTACLRTGFFRVAAVHDELLNDRRNNKFLTPEFIQSLKDQTQQYDSLRTDRSDENYQALLKTLKAIVDAGGRITAGTDAPFAPFGSSLHSELWVFVDAGLTPFQALQAATIHAAEAVGVDKDLGTIEPGKLADLVIVDGDPLNRIQDAMKVETTIKNGKMFSISNWLEN